MIVLEKRNNVDMEVSNSETDVEFRSRGQIAPRSKPRLESSDQNLYLDALTSLGET